MDKVQLEIKGDPTKIIFVDSTGSRWRVLREDDLNDWEKEFNTAIAKLKALDNRWLTKAQVKKVYHIGEEKLNRWIAEGLKEVHDEGSRLYDRKEIDKFLELKKG